MAVHGGKSKIRHKNMADGGRYGGQKINKNIRININKKLKKTMDCIQITEKKKKQKTGVKNKKGCQIEKGKKKSNPHQKRVSNRKKKTPLA